MNTSRAEDNNPMVAVPSYPMKSSESANGLIIISYQTVLGKYLYILV